MNNYLVYKIDDDLGIVCIAKRKLIGSYETPSNDLKEVIVDLKPFIEEELKNYSTVQSLISSEIEYRTIYGTLRPFPSGTDSYALTVFVVKENEGLVLTANFMIVETVNFVVKPVVNNEPIDGIDFVI